MNTSIPETLLPSPSARVQITPVVAAWAVVLLTSLLPRVILQEVFGQTVSLDLKTAMSVGVLLAALLAAQIWRPLRRLRPFLALALVFAGVQWLVYSRVDTLPVYRAWLRSPSFSVSMLAEQSLNVMVTLAVVVSLLLMKKKPRDIYLLPGDINATAQPIRWMGVGQGTRWVRFGFWLTVCISLGTLAFLVIAGRPPLDILPRVLPFLPVVLLAAALNAFTEEVSFKASFLSVLEGPVGPRQALSMVAAYFGIAHFYGVPYGVVGVVLATFLGWILARSMLETRGLFWAWFIHFWQDVWIFSFIAINAIIPGGG